MKKSENGYKIQWKDNSIDLLKMFAACSVAMVHWTKVGVTQSCDEIMMFLRQIFLSVPSVVMFFVISGFLAAVSVNKYSIRGYIVNRFCRIYPPLWVSITVNCLVLVAIWWSNLDSSFLKGIFLEVCGIAYTPSCLKNLPTGSMSGALWTVMVQLQFYVLICIAAPLLYKLKQRSWLVLLTIALGINLFFGANSSEGFLGKIAERTVFPYLIWFLYGVYAFLHLNRVVPICKKLSLPLVALLAGYALAGRPCANIGYYADVFTTLCTMPMTIGLSYFLGKIRLKREFSFSIFLYHWIVLNIFSVLGLYKVLGTALGAVIYFVVVLVVSYIMDNIWQDIIRTIVNLFNYMTKRRRRI